MIITITGADFSKSNIGTLNSWTVSKSIGAGANHSIPSFVTKGAQVSWTITLADGYTFGSYEIKMGGSTITPTVNGNTMTINLTVTGNVVIKVPTINEGTGEEDTGGDTGGNTGGITGGITGALTTVSYNEQKTQCGINKNDGSEISSGTGYINIYNNIDITKTYYVDGYAPNATGANACVCYYNESGVFISAQDGNDFGVSSANYTGKQLTIPTNTYTIKLFSRNGDQEGKLYYASPLTLVTHDSQQSSCNISGTTGEYGTSSQGYVYIYNNIDASQTYYASGFCPSSTGEAVPVCYYDESGTFISSERGADWGMSSQEFSLKQLTIPANTYTIKLFSRTINQEPALYIG